MDFTLPVADVDSMTRHLLPPVDEERKIVPLVVLCWGSSPRCTILEYGLFDLVSTGFPRCFLPPSVMMQNFDPLFEGRSAIARCSRMRRSLTRLYLLSELVPHPRSRFWMFY